MNTMIKGALFAIALSVCHSACATYTISGTVSPNVQVVNSTLIFLMDGCYHFDYGTPSPNGFAAGIQSAFLAEIDGGVTTADDITDKRYAFFATYLRQDGSTGIAVSTNPFVAGTLLGTKTYDDVFNRNGYGVTEQDLIKAITDAASDEYDIYQPARYKITDCFSTLNSYFVNDGTEDLRGTSQLDQDSILVCFSTATNGGTIRSTAGQPVPGPGAGIAMAIGLVQILKRRRKN